MSFAAFKALPIDPANLRTRSEDSSTSGSPAFVVDQQHALDDLAGARTCQEAVGLMVDAIARACADAHAGADSGKSDVVVPSVRNEDIVRSVAFLFIYSRPDEFHPLSLSIIGDVFSFF
jgi:phosphatidylinositol 4-phosphatase